MNVVISHQFWSPIDRILDFLVDKYKTSSKILELGPGNRPFKLTTHSVEIPYSIVDWKPQNQSIHQYFLDLDRELIPTENYYDFGYARHIFEDVQNPDFLFEQFTSLCREGYIETPSPLVECLKGAETPEWRGYLHHRYIVWTEDNTLHFLPKFPVIEHIVINAEVEKDYVEMANSKPFFWNNYYTWSTDTSPPRYKMYKHGRDFDIGKDYANLLQRAITNSIRSTEAFLRTHNNFE